MEEEELALILMVLCALLAQPDDLIGRLETLLISHVREQRRLNRSPPADKDRIIWYSFVDKITDTHFRRMLRVPLNAFIKLCSEIETTMGEEVFRTEKYTLTYHPTNRMIIPGEVKVAVSIRMLAGGSYLDLIPMFDVSKSGLYKILDQFLHWALSSFTYPLVKWTRENRFDALEFLANQFAEKSNGVFYGPFGALDGLAVGIRSPTFAEVADPGDYYCRKGFYALNAQAIVDKRKRYLWSYPSNKGSTHDSAAFANSRLCDLLTEEAMAQEL